MPILAKNLVSTSHPLAAEAGLKMLRIGGNAVDAAIASAITLTVVEPVNNGIGSDAFAIIWDGNKLHGLNASGKSPSGWTREHFNQYQSMPLLGWDAVTIPGAVSAWVELSKRFGNVKFEELFKPAIHYAKNGFLITPITADLWKTVSRVYKKKKFPSFYKVFMPNGKAPQPGEVFKFPAQAKTLELIAETCGNAFYHGKLADKIENYSVKTGGIIRKEDLENHTPIWVNPLDIKYRNINIHELPPNGQGLTALIALGILRNYDLGNIKIDSVDFYHLQIEAMKLAFEDAYRYISDTDFLEIKPSSLLNRNYLKKRANMIDLENAQSFKFGTPKNSDTVYLTSADKNGMMVSYIQSNYFAFGSGIVIPNTGISLQNRGNCFNLQKGHPNEVGPSKRPYHTIIPAFITKKGHPLMSFGVMGGTFQPQGHTQMITRIFDYNQNPQAAIDAPRWRVMKGLQVAVEHGFEEKVIHELVKRGHKVSKAHYSQFGGAQIIYKLEQGYLAASDSRKDGQAVGF
ncbi:MAG: gamma-glutamyltransferase [Candidatus Lokiarchaeota archaeon]|nr:gamma-glutamyltransferase [Candidatus Lokiarchaeota archaeon]MBD3201693.1 gamma-glutamyltransferase [Candidatus Lokiarchaeota archaeon]